MNPQPLGIALRPGDGALLAAVRDAVNAMNTDGVFDRMLEKWFGK
jgi:ABC-type amino acid transport substrate-binding protein